MRRQRIAPKKFDRKLFFLALGLSFFGLIVVSSASVVLSFQRFENNTYYLIRQTISVFIGIIAMLIVSRIDYRLFKKYSAFILIGAILLLGLVLIPGIGVGVGNARRWINLGSFTLQASEFAKLAVVIYLAAWFDSRQDYIHSFFAGLATPLFVVCMVAGLIILEPDFGSMTALLLIALSVMFAGGMRLSHFAGLVVSGIAVGWLAIQAAPYRLERLITFFNPEADPFGAGYQINQALLGIGSGGLWGFGYGQSRQKFNFLPEPIGDSVFAIMAEELGFVRVIFVLLAFLLFAFFGLRIARRAPDVFGSLVAVGVTMWVVIQASVNIGAIVGLLPLTGIPLPFISYGGSSVIALLVGVGILLNISRQPAIE